ncbi:DUF2388 domain-containing protein [Entomomonas asaccharolytica]|uniref:DUF2388 domain-containing protein n=1 Tax=Entomomonas asaccharolytica TaxID=2785331 RepID=A0A974RWT8_9GAMM|nr:DUF2388 domain-containing protein [Entomomonas asaccharolytica]QQP85551.1 DUF2388 domain-containing protein [Entomomonas asaccharolytica]
MKNILLITLMLILTSAYDVNAKDYNRRPPSDHHHRPHDKNNHDNNSSSGGGEAAAIILVATSITLTSYTIYQLLTEEKEDNKLVYSQAKEDAAFFIATEGQQTGVYLESAFKQLRTKPTFAMTSDMELAKAILSI